MRNKFLTVIDFMVIAAGIFALVEVANYVFYNAEVSAAHYILWGIFFGLISILHGTKNYFSRAKMLDSVKVMEEIVNNKDLSDEEKENLLKKEFIVALGLEEISNTKEKK